MKKGLLTLVLVFVASLGLNKAVAQVTVENGPKIEFDKEVHDYGDVKHKGNGECVFTFKNVGTEPLLIQSAKGSCGCTVPEWPTEPIAPGAKGTIKVKYATDRVGAINKSVTINSNAVNEPVKVVRIKGNVLPPAEGTSPVNTTGAPTVN